MMEVSYSVTQNYVGEVLCVNLLSDFKSNLSLTSYPNCENYPQMHSEGILNLFIRNVKVYIFLDLQRKKYALNLIFFREKQLYSIVIFEVLKVVGVKSYGLAGCCTL